MVRRESSVSQKPDTIMLRQDIVNGKCGVTPKKSVDELARGGHCRQVGNGSERKSRLLAEGYDYGAVQKRVNEMLS